MVLLSTKNARLKTVGSKKLLPRWSGPFPVEKRVGAVAYALRLPEHLKWHPVFHVSLLRKYADGGRVQPPPPPDLVEGELEYEVERILDHVERKSRGRTTKYDYLVKWKGYGPEHNTWEPQQNMQRCAELIVDYWSNQ